MNRRQAFLLAVTAAVIAGAPGFAAAQDKIRVGYAISKSGPNAGGATITQIPNYEMWVKEVNATARRRARTDGRAGPRRGSLS